MARKPPPPPPAYYEPLLYAFILGRTGERVTSVEDAQIAAELYGLRISKFLRKPPLPRVLKTLELIREVNPNPESILEVGCGRGTAMWPMMEALAGTRFYGADSYEGRGGDLRAMRDAGVAQIGDGYHLPAQALTGLARASHDAVLCLEVLEHLETDRDVEAAAGELLRVSRDLVLVSVPSVKDGNPDHKRLFTAGALRNLFLRAGAARVELQEVPKHFVVSVRKNP